MKQPIVPLLIVLFVAAILVGLFGLTEKKLLFLETPRSAAIALSVIGFVMCSVGALQVYIAKAPAHPMAIMGYLLGVVALLTALAQVFRLNLPFVSDPKTAIIVLLTVIALKFSIGRLSTLVALKA